MVAVGAGVSTGDKNAGGVDSVGSGGEVGKLAGDGVGKGDSKSEVGWCGKSDVTGDVGDGAWVDSLVDVAVGIGDVNTDVVNFRVSDSVFEIVGNFGGEIEDGKEMTSDVEAMATIEVEDGEAEGVMGRGLTSVPAWVGLEPPSYPHPAAKEERQMISKNVLLH